MNTIEGQFARLLRLKAFNVGRNATQTVIAKTLPHLKVNDNWRQN